MKKQTHSKIATVLARIINIRAWADYDRVKAFTRYLVNGFKRMFVPQPPNPNAMDFDEAVKAQHLTHAQLQANQKALLWLSLMMCITAVGLLGYAVYQLIFGSFLAVLISLVVMGIALALAFRYHFWYYQIKSHKLGCTFSEWFKHGLMGEK